MSENDIEYKIDSQNGLSTVFSIPISKKNIPNDIINITLKKGTTYTGVTVFNVYRGKKMVKHFYGADKEVEAYSFVKKLQDTHGE